MTDPTLRQLFAQSRLFYIKPPRGGQANDGFELLGELEFPDSRALLAALEVLGVPYTLRAAPRWHNQPPLQIDGETAFIDCPSQVTCLGFSFYLTVSPTTLRFCFNGQSHYQVFDEDIERALAFEAALMANGLLLTDYSRNNKNRDMR
uniref:hypothetical protein n=1 Tax=Thaumasiovibrio occultus TaxID=1891184 RepID=UPI000B355A43|nr:hypothetical protein [Thaumasiovibrio occultus]